MKSFHILQKEGRAALRGKWTQFALLTFVYGLLGIIFSLPDTIRTLARIEISDPTGLLLYGLNILLTLVLVVIGWGYAISLLRNLRDPYFDDMGTLFAGFKRFGHVLGTLILQGIYTFLWALLLIVPGIVKSYSYAMTPYILHDHPELSADATIEKSMRMMNGHKAELFVLHLTFIGWALLGIITLGLAFLWVGPYFYSAQAAFYEDLKAGYADELKEELSQETDDASAVRTAEIS